MPEVDSLEGMVDYLDTGIDPAEGEVGVGVVHVLLSGDGDQLRFRLRAGQAVRIHERPGSQVAEGRIAPAELTQLYGRSCPRALRSTSVITVHGCTVGAHAALTGMLWYVFGRSAQLLVPTTSIVYSAEECAAACALSAHTHSTTDTIWRNQQ